MEDHCLEVVTKCDRCKEKGFRCFVIEASGQCISCVVVDADCTVFVSEEQWEEIQRKKKEQQLVVARLRALLAHKKQELLKTCMEERSYADHDLIILDELDRAKKKAKQIKKAKKAKQARRSSKSGTDPHFSRTTAI